MIGHCLGRVESRIKKFTPHCIDRARALGGEEPHVFRGTGPGGEPDDPHALELPAVKVLIPHLRDSITSSMALSSKKG